MKQCSARDRTYALKHVQTTNTFLLMPLAAEVCSAALHALQTSPLCFRIYWFAGLAPHTQVDCCRTLYIKSSAAHHDFL